MGVTGQPLKAEVLQFAEKIVDLCNEHTFNATIASTAAGIAATVMSMQELCFSHSARERDVSSPPLG